MYFSSFIPKIHDVNIERMYTDLYNIEGIRHPISGPEHLEEVQQYIISEFENIDLDVRTQEFFLEGFDDPFVNIEAKLCDYNDGEPELLITSHYDSVDNSPGADDSGSAVGIMLETARVLKQIVDEEDIILNVRFVSFTLEEGHPTITKFEFDKGKELRLLDKRGKSITQHFNDMNQNFWDKYIQYRQDAGVIETTRSALTDIENYCNPEELEFLKGYVDTFERYYEKDKALGNVALLGSNYFVSQLDNRSLDIRGVINLECIGYTDFRENSQRLPPNVNPEMFQIHNTNKDMTVGDFAFILSDNNSTDIGRSLCKNAKLEEVNLPFAYLEGPGYEVIKENMYDILRSDHAAFWRNNIPAIMIVDGANFRTPFYHSEGDTIETLDFEFMRNVCQTVILSTIDILSN